MGSLRQQFLQRSFQAAESIAGWKEHRRRSPPAPGDIAVITCYTPDIASYGSIAAANKERYARKHGYAFKEITTGFVGNRPPAWSKINFIREALRSYRFVFWTDADALIMNDAVRLESFISPGIDVHLTRALTPFPHINTGQMFFRSSPFTRLFLAAVWRLKVFTHHPTWEQRAINHLLENYRFHRVLVSPNRVFNSLGHVSNDPDPYREGDFVIHFPGLPDKFSLVSRYASRPNSNS